MKSENDQNSVDKVLDINFSNLRSKLLQPIKEYILRDIPSEKCGNEEKGTVWGLVLDYLSVTHRDMLCDKLVDSN